MGKALTWIIVDVLNVKSPSSAFNIFNYDTSSTRSGYFSKLPHNFTPTSYTRHFYFNRIVCLWNSLPFIDLHLPFYIIKAKLYDYFWNRFVNHFNANDVHLYHFATNVPTSDIRHFSTNLLIIHVFILVPCRTCRLPLATTCTSHYMYCFLLEVFCLSFCIAIKSLLFIIIIIISYYYY